jgi:pilus assembly protein Flp/PilA
MKPSGLGGQFVSAGDGWYAYLVRRHCRMAKATSLKMSQRGSERGSSGIGKERHMTFIKMLKDESGASAAEYALILAIVGTAIALAAVLLGNSISGAMNNARDCIDNPPSAGGTCG